jgi:osmoprotectant transport system permease protein
VAVLVADARSAWLDWGWVADNTDLIWASLREHLVLTVLAVGWGLVISLPLALAARRWRWLYPPVLSVGGILYTIPSLAAYALLIPYTGLSRTTALIPLVTYTLLILVRNTVTGLDGVPAAARESATAMGYSSRQRLWRVEVPLALPAILAGVRLATVSTVGLVTVAGLVGFDNLGQFIYLRGFRDGRRTAIVVGTVLVVVVAVLADLALVAVERLAMPWRRARHRNAEEAVAADLSEARVAA